MDIWIPVVAAVLPVGLVALSQVVDRMVRPRERQIELAAGQAAEKAARYAANGAEMEQRVRVLERIVTDRGIDIADEIERLRDTPMPGKIRSN
jgi:hypothetical protein